MLIVSYPDILKSFSWSWSRALAMLDTNTNAENIDHEYKSNIKGIDMDILGHEDFTRYLVKTKTK